MNNNLVLVHKYLDGLGVSTLVNGFNSLFVSKSDVSIIGSPEELLNALRKELGINKLYWNDSNETISWYVLESF